MGESALLGALPQGSSSATFTKWSMAASAEIDSALRRAGYVTPVNFTSPSEAMERMQNQLGIVCVILALSKGLAIANAQISENLAAQAEEAKEFLTAAREGRIDFPAPRSRRSMGLADETTTPEVTPAKFSCFRAFAGGG